jgi:N-acetylglutamate synthase-like GNAT family acetyltransferase
MKEEPVTVRLAEISDYSACLPLFKLLYHGDIGPDFKNVFQDYAREGAILLARTRGKLLGILVGSYNLDIDWEGRVARIDAVVVDENYRMRGIGKMLVKRFIEAAQEENCKAVKSRINVANMISQKFHEELGFSRADTYEYFLEL